MRLPRHFLEDVVLPAATFVFIVAGVLLFFEHEDGLRKAAAAHEAAHPTAVSTLKH